MHVFGGLEEAGLPRENLCMHGKNMQIPYRKAPAEIPTVSLLTVG